MPKASVAENFNNDSPLTNFSNCHEGIVSHLNIFKELPALVDSAAGARKIASETLKFFREAVFDHHSEEEKDLFPAVLENAMSGEELNTVQMMIDRLVVEHREIEALWTHLEPGLAKLASGHLVDVDAVAIEKLVAQYTAHARLEESEFLPLAEKILGRNDRKMADLGLSLHTRHVFRAARRGMRGS
jgi:hemerythrin-like domain-containing protein